MNPIQSEPTEVRYCGLFRRLLAMTYDALIVIALLMIAALVALPFSGPDVRAGRDLVYTLYLLIAWFAYFGWCWRTTRATLGMRAWRVRLVTQDGAKPGWGSCALRFVIAMVSGLAGGVGFAWALFDKRRRCWHDLATGSWLVVEPRRSNRSS